MLQQVGRGKLLLHPNFQTMIVKHEVDVSPLFNIMLQNSTELVVEDTNDKSALN